MKKWLLLFILFSLPLSGCWDRVDVDELAIVMGLGIDRVPDDERPILLSAQVVNPAALKSGGMSPGQGNPIYVLTSQGKTVSEAVRNFSQAYPRRFIFSHNKVIVLGKEFAESDITEALDFIDRNREFRENSRVLTAVKTAKEVMQTEIALENIPVKGLHTMMAQLAENAFTVPIEFYKFRNQLKGELKTATSPLLLIEAQDKKVDEMLEESAGDKLAKSKFVLDKITLIDGTAIFKDQRMIGKIEKSKARGLLWIRNELRGGMVIISGPGKQEISVFIPEGKTKITPSVKGNRISMKIECKGEAEVSEVKNLRSDLSDPKVIQHLEKQVEAILTSRVKEVIEVAQHELKADFIGFSSILHNELPDDWKRFKKDWPEVFPEVEYNIDFHITIQTVGVIEE